MNSRGVTSEYGVEECVVCTRVGSLMVYSHESLILFIHIFIKSPGLGFFGCSVLARFFVPIHYTLRRISDV